MEVQRTLAKNLDSAGDKASLDACCKRLLANKMILAWIMKECLQEYQNCTITQIAANFIEGNPQVSQTAVNPDEMIQGLSTEDSTMHEGTITYDIRFFAIAPVSRKPIRLIINVEAQNDFYPGYPIIKRGIYYCSRMISSQYGTEFTGSHYENIKKVYSIWICTNPPAQRRNSIIQYSIQEKALIGTSFEKIENYDLMTAIIICLGKPGGQNYTGILKLLEVLLSSDRDANEKKRILQNDFHIPMTRDLEKEVLDMCNLSKGIEEKGIAIGLERGLQRGMERGKETEMLRAVQSLMETLHLSAEQAMAALKISETEQKKLISMLYS